MIQYNIYLSQKIFVPQQNIKMTVRIVNNGSTAIEVPDPSKTGTQPTYRITGPKYVAGKAFSTYSVEQEKHELNSPQQERAPILISILPGQVWEKKLLLSGIIDLNAIGEYVLESNLSWKDIHLSSEPVRFRIDSLSAASIQIGRSSQMQMKSEGECALIHRAADASQIFIAQFRENRPDISEMSSGSLIPLTSAGAIADDILVPWTNSGFFESPIRWFLWREGKTLKALANSRNMPLSLELPTDKTQLVIPPLDPKDSNLEVFAVTGDGRVLMAYSFNSGAANTEKSVKQLWEIQLPAKPTEIISTLSTPSSGSQRHIGFVVQRTNGIEIYHAKYKEGHKIEPFQSIDYESARMLVNAPISIYVDADANVYISVLTVTDEAAHKVAIVEARFGPNGKPIGKPTLTHLGTLPGQLIDGKLLYVDSEGKIMRRDIVIVIEGNHLFKWDPIEGMEPIPNRGSPVMPLVLVPGRETSYVMYLDPIRGCYFEPI